MRKRLITAIIALSLALCCLVGVTLAWIVDSTNQVVNTFTYGDINIDLTETVGTENKSAATNKVTNDTFKMVPGETLTKDPKVTVKSGSEACWLFVEVTKSSNFANFMTYAMDSNWTALETSANGLTTVYYYNGTELDALLTADKTYNVLKDNEVTVLDSVTKGDLTALTDATLPTLTFTAYAIQKANIDTPADAWAEIGA